MSRAPDPAVEGVLADLRMTLDEGALVIARGREAFFNDVLLRRAAETLLSRLGEAASRLPAGYRTSHPDVSWAQVMGMRNRIVHAYHATDYEIVWATLEADFPALKTAVGSQPSWHGGVSASRLRDLVGNGQRGTQGDDMAELIMCQPKALPRNQWAAAARTAIEVNPLNYAPVDRLIRVMPKFKPTSEHLAVLTTKYWHTAGVHLTVAFLDNPPADLRRRILSHMNSWAAYANVKFRAVKTDPQVRIARVAGDGYWSYLGTDVLQIPAGQPTMNLDSFSMQTPESEYHRVVRHETGHTMGFPHEHMRRELVDKIDPQKAIAYFESTQGWTEEEVRQQVLTPLEESSLLGTAHADPNSIMCYQIPGSITKDGQPIVGGIDIDASDQAFVAKVYPKKVHRS